MAPAKAGGLFVVGLGSAHSLFIASLLRLEDISRISIGKRALLELASAIVLPTGVVSGRQNPRHFGLAARLKRARKAASLSFASVAEAAGLTDGNTVLHLERKAGHVPRVDTVEKIAHALGLSPGFLAYGLPGDCPRGEGLHADGVGARLRAARLDRGLNMRDLGRQSQTSHTTVRLTESGETVPSIATAEVLAQALGVSPGWLAYGIGPQVLPPRRRGRSPAQSPEPAR